MNSPIWAGAYYAGIASVLAVGVAFPGWPAWLAALAVMAGYGWLLRVGLRAIDDFYERADRDAG